MNATSAARLRLVPPAPRVAQIEPDRIRIRNARTAEAASIHTLIEEYLEEGHLLSRELDEIAVRADHFVVAVQPAPLDLVLACAELAPLSSEVAEVRSLVVDRAARGFDLGRLIVEDLLKRARIAGFYKLCAFTHSPAYFAQMGFSIVPHVWLPEKIVTDCQGCRHFRRCRQYALMRTLSHARETCVPLAALHG
jgi:N-acetylglutamate synthase-like GNAT family acetyltransferase